MLLDQQALFSDDQAVTTTAASENFINLGATATPPGAPAALKRDLGPADLDLLVQVTGAFAGGTSIAVSVETDDNSAFSSAKTVATTPAVALADLKAGYIFPVPEFPIGTVEPYVRLKYTVVGTMK